MLRFIPHQRIGRGLSRVERLLEHLSLGLGTPQAARVATAAIAAHPRSSSRIAASRMRYFWILPVTVIGNSATKLT